MGLLSKVFKSSDSEAPIEEKPACPHVTLVPRWDNAADMGDPTRATSYLCEGCQQSFSAAEAAQLLDSEEQRLSAIIGDEESPRT